MNLHINVIRGCCVLGYFQRRAERMSSMQSFSAYMLIWPPLFFFQSEYEPCWNSLCVPVHFPRGPKSLFFFFFCTCTQNYAAHTCTRIRRAAGLRSEGNGCTLGHVKKYPGFPGILFCRLMICSCDTAKNIAVESGSSDSSQAVQCRAEHTISEHMQIYTPVEEVTHVTNPQGSTRSLWEYLWVRINRSPSFGNYTDPSKRGLSFTVHVTLPPPNSACVGARKPLQQHMKKPAPASVKM